MKGFKNFLFQGNILDLAVAFIIGSAFAAVVKALVADLFTPLLSIPGKNATSFASLSFHIGGGKFLYGDFVNAVIEFVVIAGAIYFIVVKPAESITARLQVRKGEAVPTTKDCPLCLSTIPLAATRCAFCTAEVPAGS